MRWLLTVLLVGCAREAVSPAPEPVEEEHYPPAPVMYAAPVADTPPPLTKRMPCPQCGEKRDALKGAEQALGTEASRREAYVKTNCKGIVTHTTRTFLSGARVSGGPERAWLCNGKLVEMPETKEEQALAIRIGDLHRWIKDNCENDAPPAVGEKLCVAP
jgi:hypothetical protein